MNRMDKASDVLGLNEQTSESQTTEAATDNGTSLENNGDTTESESELTESNESDDSKDSNLETVSSNSDDTVSESEEQTDNTEVSTSDDTEVIQLNEDLKKVYTIYFDPDKYELKSDYVDILDVFFELSMETDSVIVIEGNYNGGKNNKPEMFLNLSMNRALVAKTYLISKGIDQGRIEIVNNGANKPLSNDLSDNEIMKNRRVDMFFKEYYK